MSLSPQTWDRRRTVLKNYKLGAAGLAAALSIATIGLAAAQAGGSPAAATPTATTPTTTGSATQGSATPTATKTATTGSATPSATKTATTGSASPPTGAGSTSRAPDQGGPKAGPGAKHKLTIVSVAGNVLTLKNADGTQQTVTADAAVAVTRAGQTIKLGDLHAGDTVDLHSEKQSNGASKLVSIKIVLPKVDGVVASITSTSLTLTAKDGASKSVALAATTTYTKFGKAATAATIVVGDKVHAEGTLEASGNLAALSIRIDAPKVDGEVTAVSGNVITVAGKDGSKTVTVATGTTYTRAGAAAALTDVTAGSRIHTEGTLQSDGSLTAVVVKIQLPKVHGEVTAVTATSVTVSGKDTAHTFVINAATAYTKGGVAAKSSDVTAGTHVDAEGPAASDGTITAITVKIRP